MFHHFCPKGLILDTFWGVAQFGHFFDPESDNWEKTIECLILKKPGYRNVTKTVSEMFLGTILKIEEYSSFEDEIIYVTLAQA